MLCMRSLQGHCVVNKLLGFLYKFKYWITFISSLEVTFTGGNTMLWWSDKFELSLFLSNSNDFWTSLWVYLDKNEKLLSEGGSSQDSTVCTCTSIPPPPLHTHCLSLIKTNHVRAEADIGTGRRQKGEERWRRDVLWKTHINHELSVKSLKLPLLLSWLKTLVCY